MEFKGFILDEFQEEAINAIDQNQSVIVSAPTGSGKTLIADYIIHKSVPRGIRIIYTAPIKALSNQKYKEFCKDYGEENIGLLTGDIVKNPGAPVLIMTTEIYRNMALVGDPIVYDVHYVIFDEIHFINDIERGYVWEESIIFSRPQVRFLCLSATIPNAKEFGEWIEAIKEHPVRIVRHNIRNVPLDKKFFDTDLGITTLEEIQKIKDIPEVSGRRRQVHRQKVIPPGHVDLIGQIMTKLPCFFFCFSRIKCQDYALELKRKNIFSVNPQIISFIRQKLAEAPPEINQLHTTKLLRETLPYGVGFHHAGLLPIMKELVEELFSQGLLKVLYTTETFAVGINMPAKTVCFESFRKYDGINFRYVNSKEYFQIAGRAGRRGIDTIGFSYVMVDRRDFDYGLYRKITDKDTEPIRSQFKLSVNTVLNLVKQHNDEEIATILSMNFFTFQKHHKDFKKARGSHVHARFGNIKQKLMQMEYILEGQLTQKGHFSSTIYADEILTGELFATDFYQQFNEFQLLMLIACLSYEPRERTKFFAEFNSDFLNALDKVVKSHILMKKDKRFKHLRKLSALVHPCYHGKSVFDILKNTNLSEGDVIRFFRQMLDKIGQIRNSTQDQGLKDILYNCQKVIVDSLEKVDNM